MVRYTPKQIGVFMADCGWVVPYGIQVHQDGSVSIVDPAARKAAIAFFDTAIAVCLAESGGNPLAKNPNSPAKGLWQIMESVHTAAIKEQAIYWQAELGYKKLPNVFEPHVNTGVARQLQQAQGWKPWEVFTTGAYKSKLGHGAEVFNYLNSPSMNAEKIRALTQEYLLGIAEFKAGAAAVSPALAVAGDTHVDSLVGTVLGWLKSAGITVGVFLLALLLIILGVWFVLSRRNIVKKAVKLTPAGAIKDLVS